MYRLQRHVRQNSRARSSRVSPFTKATRKLGGNVQNHQLQNSYVYFTTNIHMQSLKTFPGGCGSEALCGLGVYLIFQQEGGKCCQITNTCSLCKMLSTRLLCTPCFSLSSAVHCSPLLNDWRGQWGSQKNLKPRWPPASSFNQRPRGLLTHKHATSQCWLLQATWNPLPLDQGLLLRCISWAWLPDVLGTN